MPRVKRTSTRASTDHVQTHVDLLNRAANWKQPEPPVDLTPEERLIFEDCLRHRSIEQLMASPLSDLHLMCQLSRATVLLNTLQKSLATDGPFAIDPRGKQVAHPATTMIDQTTRSILALTKALQLSTAALIGPSDENRDRRTRTSKIESRVRGRDYDDLLA